MERFESWFFANGGFLSQSIEIFADDKEQHSVRVRSGHTVQGSETVVSCPPALTFNYASFDQSESGARATRIDRTSFSQDTSLRLLLMEQYLLGEKSFWWPYISILPQPCLQKTVLAPMENPPSMVSPNQNLHTPLFFDAEDMLWLEGTNLGVAARARASTWKKEFEAAKNALNGFGENMQDLWSSDLYIWAATIMTSRSFSSSALRISSLDSPILIPGVDLLNHSPSAKVTWEWGTSACTIQTDEQLFSGNQVFNNYGPKGNEELLMGYGFCLESNQADSFNLTYSPALSHHMDAVKSRISESKYKIHQSEALSAQLEVTPSPTPGIGESTDLSSEPRTEHTPLKDIKFVMLGEDDYRFSPGFLADCSLALLNGRERNQRMTCTLHDYKFSNTTLSRNKLHTLCSIIMILQEKRAEIRKHDHILPLAPRNENQHYASLYRSSQLRILEAVLGCLSSTLQAITQLTFPDHPHHSRIIRIADILTTRPKALKPHFREVVHAGVGSRDPSKVIMRRGVEFAFAMWLCGLRLLHQSGDLRTTEPVLDQWIAFLCVSYDTPSPGEEMERWLARTATASCKADDVAGTAGSYVKAVEMAVEKHPESLYRDEWASSVSNLMWCLVVAREERVRCPTVVESGILGEEDDEFVLIIDLEG